jgi:hypothetical protein
MNMNTNENSPKANPRLRRIQKVVWVVKALIVLAVVSAATGILIYLGCVAGWINVPSVALPPLFWKYTWKYSSPDAVPASILILGFARAGLFFSGAFVLNRLLGYFARGNFFTAKSISCIKWLGGLVMSDWLAVKLLDAIGSRMVMLAPADFTKLAIGFLIILIAWIMDEGRKIQEEQELTV